MAYCPPAVHEIPPEPEDLLQEVLRGLSEPQKTLPCKLLYDEYGSQLFDRITELPEYYPTRTERAIMERYVDEIAAQLGAGRLVIEYGSGTSEKTRLLLNALELPAGYVPIDIAREHLETAAAALCVEFPDMPIHPIWADYTAPVTLPDTAPLDAPRLVYFPGSTIGNFRPDDAVAFLRRVAKLCAENGHLLIGVDLKKDRRTLENAYNDKEGVTAAFNLNLLSHLNKRLDTQFPLALFRHHAPYNDAAGRIEMHLVCDADLDVRVNGSTVHFKQGESVRTELSYKYALAEFAALAARAGFAVERVWTDPQQLFSVQLLRLQESGR